MKKITALVLSFIILTGLLVPVYAADETKIEVPKIKITTVSGIGTTLQKAMGYVDASISITDTDNTTVSDSIVVKVRGNSTAFESIAKKSYTFKFDKKKNVLNMGSGKKWALVSNIYDPTLARNYTAFSLAHELGIQYTSDYKVVEVWMDNSFRGCYLLFEPVDKGNDRVNINVNENDFMLELEALREEDDVTYFKSNGIRFAVSEPDSPSAEDVSYMQSTMDDVISTVKNGSEEEIKSKIDIESFVKFYLLNEFLKTVDFDFSSVFYYYKDGKLYAGPPWDYDLSSGNVNADFSSRYASSYKTDGLFISNYNLYKWLCAKPWFYDLAKSEFTEHYGYFASIPADGGVIDSFYNTYENVIKRNFNDAGWPVNRYYVNVMKYPLSTYEENYDFYVNWCKERVDWLTEYFEVDPSTMPTTAEATTEIITTESVPATETTFEPVESTSVEPTETTTAVETTIAEPTSTSFIEPTTSVPVTEPDETTTPYTDSTQLTESTTEPVTADTTAPIPTEPFMPKSINFSVDAALKAGQTLPFIFPNTGEFKISDTKTAVVKNGEIIALKKGEVTITEIIGNISLIHNLKVTTSPKLGKTSITVKKGKSKTVKIIGKAKAVNNKYKNTKKAKIVSKKSSSAIKIRGLKKGKTTLYVFVNGVKLKLKVKIK
ncbi:MAG: CotH kinase family protein [Ruminococcus sp.]|nr:CotH kinase family protein [Ruminococcus sp.]